MEVGEGSSEGTAVVPYKLFGADLPNRLSWAILRISTCQGGWPRPMAASKGTQALPRGRVTARFTWKLEGREVAVNTPRSGAFEHHPWNGTTIEVRVVPYKPGEHGLYRWRISRLLI